MFQQILNIVRMIIDSFLHIWPYLLLTIPLAVAVQMSGAARYINQALKSRPVSAIFLAGIVGAFSPFCSCGVIPIIAALLMGGIPLAPVMTFWIASPSMDPEIFFLSVAMLGWKLAVWRLAATLILSLSAGGITHLFMQHGWLGQQILRTQPVLSPGTRWQRLQRSLKERLATMFSLTNVAATQPLFELQTPCCATAAATEEHIPETHIFSGTSKTHIRSDVLEEYSSCSCGCSEPQVIRVDAPTATCGCGSSAQTRSFWQQLGLETWKAAAMVIKFMTLAFFLKTLITLYAPTVWITQLLGHDNPYSIVMAALIGVPIYTGNLAALPMIGGLLAQGMNPAAALAFLISGPTTTLPAMAAVWGLTTRRVFALYVSFSLFGALMSGYLYHFFAQM